MKQKILAPLAASVALALAGMAGSANAALVIDPTGSYGTGNVVTLHDSGSGNDTLGSDFGDMLLKDLLNAANTVGTSANGGVSFTALTGTVFSQNVFGLPAGTAGEITFIMSMAATSSGGYVKDSSTGFNNANLLIDNPFGAFASNFELYYDPLTGADSGLQADHDTGLGYSDGVLLASGTVKIRTTPASGASQFKVTQDLNTGYVALDDETCPTGGSTTTDGCILTGDLGGSQFLTVDLLPTTLDTTGYLRNDIAALSVDISLSKTALAPYASVFASDVVAGTMSTTTPGTLVAGTGGILNTGGDGSNDLFCGLLDGTATCDVQYQINTVMTINGPVPEPATLALLGLGFGLIGISRRRRKVS